MVRKGTRGLNKRTCVVPPALPAVEAAPPAITYGGSSASGGIHHHHHPYGNGIMGGSGGGPGSKMVAASSSSSISDDEACPQCGVSYNTTNFRKLQEECGHHQCRNCVLNSERCKLCFKEGPIMEEPTTPPQLNHNHSRSVNTRRSAAAARLQSATNSRTNSINSSVRPTSSSPGSTSNDTGRQSSSVYSDSADSDSCLRFPSSVIGTGGGVVEVNDVYPATIDFETMAELTSPTLVDTSYMEFSSAVDSKSYSSIVSEENEFSKSLMSLRKMADPNLNNNHNNGSRTSPVSLGTNSHRGLVTRAQLKEMPSLNLVSTGSSTATTQSFSNQSSSSPSSSRLSGSSKRRSRDSPATVGDIRSNGGNGGGSPDITQSVPKDLPTSSRLASKDSPPSIAEIGTSRLSALLRSGLTSKNTRTSTGAIEENQARATHSTPDPVEEETTVVQIVTETSIATPISRASTPDVKKEESESEPYHPETSNSTVDDQNNDDNEEDDPLAENEKESEPVPKKKKKRSPVVIHDHITILGGEPPMYQCNLCNKKFKTKAHIKYHEFCQKGDKPFKCETCGQGFIAKSHYEYHIRTHTGERPYTCPKCGKGFNQQGKVTRHMRSHTGEKPFVCQECNRGFANAQALRCHTLIHTGERPFACTYCNKRFTGMTNLKKHVITHTGERPFSCTHCGKSFGLKWTLDLHLRTHSTERPYACDQCTRAFSNSKDLRRHLVIHSGERPFKCWLCGTSFRRKDNLDRHIKNTHNQSREVAKQLANEAAAEYLKNNSKNQSLGNIPVSKVNSIVISNIINNKDLMPAGSMMGANHKYKSVVSESPGGSGSSSNVTTQRHIQPKPATVKASTSTGKASSPVKVDGKSATSTSTPSSVQQTKPSPSTNSPRQRKVIITAPLSPPTTRAGKSKQTDVISTSKSKSPTKVKTSSKIKKKVKFAPIPVETSSPLPTPKSAPEPLQVVILPPPQAVDVAHETVKKSKKKSKKKKKSKNKSSHREVEQHREETREERVRAPPSPPIQVEFSTKRFSRRSNSGGSRQQEVQGGEEVESNATSTPEPEPLPPKKTTTLSFCDVERRPVLTLVTPPSPKVEEGEAPTTTSQSNHVMEVAEKQTGEKDCLEDGGVQVEGDNDKEGEPQVECILPHDISEVDEKMFHEPSLGDPSLAQLNNGLEVESQDERDDTAEDLAEEIEERADEPTLVEREKQPGSKQASSVSELPPVSPQPPEHLFDDEDEDECDETAIESEKEEEAQSNDNDFSELHTPPMKELAEMEVDKPCEEPEQTHLDDKLSDVSSGSFPSSPPPELPADDVESYWNQGMDAELSDGEIPTEKYDAEPTGTLLSTNASLEEPKSPAMCVITMTSSVLVTDIVITSPARTTSPSLPHSTIDTDVLPASTESQVEEEDAMSEPCSSVSTMLPSVDAESTDKPADQEENKLEEAILKLEESSKKTIEEEKTGVEVAETSHPSELEEEDEEATVVAKEGSRIVELELQENPAHVSIPAASPFPVIEDKVENELTELSNLSKAVADKWMLSADGNILLDENKGASIQPEVVALSEKGFDIQEKLALQSTTPPPSPASTKCIKQLMEEILSQQEKKEENEAQKGVPDDDNESKTEEDTFSEGNIDDVEGAASNLVIDNEANGENEDDHSCMVKAIEPEVLDDTKPSAVTSSDLEETTSPDTTNIELEVPAHSSFSMASSMSPIDANTETMENDKDEDAVSLEESCALEGDQDSPKVPEENENSEQISLPSSPQSSPTSLKSPQPKTIMIPSPEASNEFDKMEDELDMEQSILLNKDVDMGTSESKNALSTPPSSPIIEAQMNDLDARAENMDVDEDDDNGILETSDMLSREMIQQLPEELEEAEESESEEVNVEVTDPEPSEPLATSVETSSEKVEDDEGSGTLNSPKDAVSLAEKEDEENFEIPTATLPALPNDETEVNEGNDENVSLTLNESEHEDASSNPKTAQELDTGYEANELEEEKDESQSADAVGLESKIEADKEHLSPTCSVPISPSGSPTPNESAQKGYDEGEASPSRPVDEVSEEECEEEEGNVSAHTSNEEINASANSIPVREEPEVVNDELPRHTDTITFEKSKSPERCNVDWEVRTPRLILVSHDSPPRASIHVSSEDEEEQMEKEQAPVIMDVNVVDEDVDDDDDDRLYVDESYVTPNVDSVKSVVEQEDLDVENIKSTSDNDVLNEEPPSSPPPSSSNLMAPSPAPPATNMISDPEEPAHLSPKSREASEEKSPQSTPNSTLEEAQEVINTSILIVGKPDRSNVPTTPPRTPSPSQPPPPAMAVPVIGDDENSRSEATLPQDISDFVLSVLENKSRDSGTWKGDDLESISSESLASPQSDVENSIKMCIQTLESDPEDDGTPDVPNRSIQPDKCSLAMSLGPIPMPASTGATNSTNSSTTVTSSPLLSRCTLNISVPKSPERPSDQIKPTMESSSPPPSLVQSHVSPVQTSPPPSRTQTQVAPVSPDHPTMQKSPVGSPKLTCVESDQQNLKSPAVLPLVPEYKSPPMVPQEELPPTTAVQAIEKTVEMTASAPPPKISSPTNLNTKPVIQPENKITTPTTSTNCSATVSFANTLPPVMKTIESHMPSPPAVASSSSSTVMIRPPPPPTPSQNVGMPRNGLLQQIVQGSLRSNQYPVPEEPVARPGDKRGREESSYQSLPTRVQFLLPNGQQHQSIQLQPEQQLVPAGAIQHQLPSSSVAYEPNLLSFMQPDGQQALEGNYQLVYAAAAATAERDEGVLDGPPNKVRLLYAEALGVGSSPQNGDELQFYYAATTPDQQVQHTSTPCHVQLMEPYRVTYSRNTDNATSEMLQYQVQQQPPQHYQQPQSTSNMNSQQVLNLSVNSNPVYYYSTPSNFQQPHPIQSSSNNQSQQIQYDQQQQGAYYNTSTAKLIVANPATTYNPVGAPPQADHHQRHHSQMRNGEVQDLSGRKRLELPVQMAQNNRITYAHVQSQDPNRYADMLGKARQMKHVFPQGAFRHINSYQEYRNSGGASHPYHQTSNMNGSDAGGFANEARGNGGSGSQKLSGLDLLSAASLSLNDLQDETNRTHAAAAAIAAVGELARRKRLGGQQQDEADREMAGPRPPTTDVSHSNFHMNHQNNIPPQYNPRQQQQIVRIGAPPPGQQHFLPPQQSLQGHQQYARSQQPPPPPLSHHMHPQVGGLEVGGNVAEVDQEAGIRRGPRKYYLSRSAHLRN